MTTIATDGKTIAADGLAVSNSTVMARSVNKVVQRDGKLYAMTGTSALFEALIAWHIAGSRPSEVPTAHADCSWELLVIDGEGRGYSFHKMAPYANEVEFPTAFGSGRVEAMAAMMAGATPKRAVEIAAVLDIHTGGAITETVIADALRQAPTLVVAGDAGGSNGVPAPTRGRPKGSRNKPKAEAKLKRKGRV